MGAHGPGQAGLPGGLAIHLTATAQLPCRLRRALPAGVRGRPHSGPAVAARGGAHPIRARARRCRPALRRAGRADLRPRRGAERRSRARAPRNQGVRRTGARRDRPAGQSRRRPRRPDLGRRDPERDRRSAHPDRQGRRHPDPAFRASRRRRVLRSGDQQAPVRRPGRRAVGPRHRPGSLSRVLRAEAEPARAAPIAFLRRSARMRWACRRTGTAAVAGRRSSGDGSLCAVRLVLAEPTDSPRTLRGPRPARRSRGADGAAQSSGGSAASSSSTSAPCSARASRTTR